MSDAKLIEASASVIAAGASVLEEGLRLNLRITDLEEALGTLVYTWEAGKLDQFEIDVEKAKRVLRGLPA